MSKFVFQGTPLDSFSARRPGSPCRRRARRRARAATPLTRRWPSRVAVRG